MFRLDHVGLVVADLDAAIDWYTNMFGFTVAWREAETDVDPLAIGLPGEKVRLKGAILATGTAFFELHQYLTPPHMDVTRRTCDRGYGHVAFWADDVDSAVERLAAVGMEFNGPPRTIASGGLTGFRWVYGKDPWGNVIEICHHPAPPRADPSPWR